MILLPTYKEVLRKLGIYPNAESGFMFVDKFITTIMYGMLFMSLAFLAFDAKSVGDLTIGFYSTGVFTLYSLVYTVFINGKFTLFKLFAEAEEYITLRKRDDSIEIYRVTNFKSEQMCKRFIIGTFITCSGVYLMPFLVPLVSYLNGSYSAEVWFLPYPSTSVRQINRYGFSVTLIWQEMGAILVSTIFALKITLFLSFCWFYTAFINDIISSFEQINELIQNEATSRSRLEIKKHLIEIIELHAWSTNHMERVSDFFSLIIFVMIGVSVSCTCTLLYQMELLVSQLNYLLMQSIGIWLSAVACLLIFCVCGDLVSGKSFEAATACFNSLWYNDGFPLNYRKFNILILAFAQNPIQISGLGVIQCSLNSFLSLMKFALSVFMLFRKFRDTN